MDQTLEFLQSEQWLRFQEAVGRETVKISDKNFSANGIIHRLPIVGSYLYVPRGPLINQQTTDNKEQLTGKMRMVVELAKAKQAKWIRIEPQTKELLEMIKGSVPYKMVKAPHDVQPKEIFVVDILPGEDELLAAMKSKTRYNIRLAQKKGVKVFVTREEKYRQAFLDLMQRTADRKEITPHSRMYYEKFLTVFPEEMCRLFVAEYEGQVLAANLLIVYGATATYLHGGSGDTHRDAMAPYLLQWEQMRFAKAHGCTHYDFGGVKTVNSQQLTANNKQTEDKDSWSGITRFKTGFSPQTAPIIFPGAYDIILHPLSYALYRIVQRIRAKV
ncbi:MAG TPA: peptidoglycan bridge formation glycyltransferase FemA/FemB family protein [Patescibacteria group bacterium]|nr:peptidoglycan bridge formation glycyltransferase FemA/FemB family protein [Patescibacteria group bacterium]